MVAHKSIVAEVGEAVLRLFGRNRSKSSEVAEAPSFLSKTNSPERKIERRLAAILAADMVGYSRLIANDEQGTIARLQTLRDALFVPQISKFSGRLVKTMGDGLLVEFPSVVDAVACAVAVQESLAKSDADEPDVRRIRFRIGINLGDVMIEDDDILGDGVNVAARMEELAEPGGICVSDKVFEEVHNKLEVTFEDFGRQKIKNIVEPVHVYRICLGEIPPPKAVDELSSKQDISAGPAELARLARTTQPDTGYSGDLAPAYSDNWQDISHSTGRSATGHAVKYADDPHLSQLTLSHKETLSAGQLQVIGLGKIRDQFGSRWDQVAERIHRIAEDTIHKRLAATDLYYHDAKFGYVILFSELTKTEAKIKCGLIAEEIVHTLLGDDEVGKTAEMKAIVASFKGALLAEGVDLWEFVQKQLADELVINGAGIADSLHISADRPLQLSHLVPSPAFSYQPIWDVSRNALLYFLCTLHFGSKSSDTMLGALGKNDHSSSTLVADIDLTNLKQLVEDLRHLDGLGRRLVLVCQCHIQTLAMSRTRAPYIDLCQSIPASLQPYIVFEIVGVSEALPRYRLADLIPYLSPFCRAINVLVPPNLTSFDAFAEAGVHSVGLDLSINTETQAKQFRQLETFSHRANQAKLHKFVYGVDKISQATFAVCAGFEYIGGTVIGKSIDTPERGYRFQPTDLFSQLFTAA